MAPTQKIVNNWIILIFQTKCNRTESSHSAVWYRCVQHTEHGQEKAKDRVLSGDKKESYRQTA